MGTHSISAVYSGDGTFAARRSAVAARSSIRPGQTAALADPTSPSVFGQAIALTATVAAAAPGAGLPTGTVTFEDNGVALTGGSDVAVTDGAASLSISSMSVGTGLITAVYSGDGNFTGSTSAVDAHAVDQAGTTTTLADSANPSASGQPVTFTATVSANAPGAGTPTGTVTFEADGTPLPGDSAVALLGGTASFVTSALPLGDEAITAVYSGDGNFTGSASAADAHTVSSTGPVLQAATATIDDLANPSVFGEPVTFEVTVSPVSSGGGTPTGSVTFEDDGVALPGDSTFSLSDGTALFGTSALPVGTSTIMAVYSGDSNFSYSTGSVSHVVGEAATATTIDDSASPSVLGQLVTLTATVTPSAGWGAGSTPTGTVTFDDNGVALPGNSTVSLDPSTDTASFTTSSLAVGSHSITVVYSGDGNFTGSTSAADGHTVNPAATTTALGDSLNPSVYGQWVTFTASASSEFAGAVRPRGP